MCSINDAYTVCFLSHRKDSRVDFGPVESLASQGRIYKGEADRHTRVRFRGIHRRPGRGKNTIKIESVRPWTILHEVQTSILKSYPEPIGSYNSF